MFMDTDETAANQLAARLQEAGVECVVHWDRSPWGVRIPLTEDRGEYMTPSLFALTEMGTWFGALGGFDEDTDLVLTDLLINFNTGFDTAALTQILVILSNTLKKGVQA